VAVLILDRALRGERRSATALAAGAAAAEAAHACFVGLMLPLLLVRVPSVLTLARGAGAVMLLLVGLVLAIRPAVVSRSNAKRRGGDFATGLAAAGLNPTLVASWTAVISALYGEQLLQRESVSALPFAIGVGSGVLAWLVAVIRFAQRYRNQMDERRRRHLVRGFGIFLMGLGAYFGIRLAVRGDELPVRDVAATVDGEQPVQR
jgi:threonine/homoserine/homoserine lactone efflux protein